MATTNTKPIDFAEEARKAGAVFVPAAPAAPAAPVIDYAALAKDAGAVFVPDPKPVGDYTVGTKAADLAKMTESGLVSGVASIPLGVEAGVRNLPRNVVEAQQFDPYGLAVKAATRIAERGTEALTGKEFPLASVAILFWLMTLLNLPS
jgi:hypothetical protein